MALNMSTGPFTAPTPSQTPGMCDPRSFYGNAAGCKLFLNEKDSDVSIRVEFEERQWHFPVHKLILSCMSEVFRTMFNTDMYESLNRQIIIRDFRPLTVKQFLRYLYLGGVDFNGWRDAADLLKIAHKYNVHTLVILCETYLISVTSFSNACYLYDLARTYSLCSLEKKSYSFVIDTAFVVSATEGFFNLAPNSLEQILSCDRLNVETECSVLCSLREWAVVECSRSGHCLTRENVLAAMEPFMKYIKWELIPCEMRTFVPPYMAEKYSGQSFRRRKHLHVPVSIKPHVTTFKFVIDLGAFCDAKASQYGDLTCLKFGVDRHAFVVGFRIVGMFKLNSMIALGASSLNLGRIGNSSSIQFNLNSLPWTEGSSEGDYAWREMTAFLPYPIRIDPFSLFSISLKCGLKGDHIDAKWPITRLESGGIVTALGLLNFQCYSQSFGITQLFLLPAPSFRNMCNN